MRILSSLKTIFAFSVLSLQGYADPQFDSDELDELERLRSLVEQNNVSYEPVYDYIYERITDNIGTDSEVPKVGVDKSVWLWVQGARDVNSGKPDFFSNFIREYTAEQYRLRIDPDASESEIEQRIQVASNEIADSFAIDIKDRAGELPSLRETGVIDAGAAASRVFSSSEYNITQDYAPWAGTTLFPFLGHGAYQGETAEGSFFSQWILQNDKVPNPEGGYFKATTGTYDLVSIATVSHNITTLLDGAIASININETISTNSVGKEATEGLLSELRQSANSFFQSAYGVGNADRFQIGDHLPLYGSAWNYALHPNYLLGSLGDDVGFWTRSDILNVGNDIVNLGPGDDHVLGSTGDDLIDGHEGYDTADYSELSNGLRIYDQNVDGSLYQNRILVEGGNGLNGFTDYLYGFERLVLTNEDDEVEIKGISTLAIDGGTGSNTLFVEGLYDSDRGSAIVISNDVENAKQGLVSVANFNKFVSTQSADFSVKKIGNDFSFAEGVSDKKFGLSYASYEESLYFDLSSQAVRNFYGESDYFEGYPNFHGTDHGDLYRTDIEAWRAGLRYSSIFSGGGDDTYSSFTDRLSFPSIYYGGGDDVVDSNFTPFASGVVMKFIMPVGVSVSDVDSTVINRKIASEDDSRRNYRADLKVMINGHGSVVYKNAIIYTYFKDRPDLDSPYENTNGFETQIGLYLYTQSGVTGISFSTQNVTMPTPPEYSPKEVPLINGVDTIRAYHGTRGPDTIDLSEYTGFSSFYGHAGNDVVVDGPSNNQIYLGEGDADSVEFPSKFELYSFAGTPNALTVDGPQGTDKLYGVEVLKFSDLSVSTAEVFDFLVLEEGELEQLIIANLSVDKLNASVSDVSLQIALNGIFSDPQKTQELIEVRDEFLSGFPDTENPLLERISEAASLIRNQFSIEAKNSVTSSIEVSKGQGLRIAFTNISGEAVFIRPLIGGEDALRGNSDFKAYADETMLLPGESLEVGDITLQGGESSFFKASVEGLTQHLAAQYLRDI